MALGCSTAFKGDTMDELRLRDALQRRDSINHDAVRDALAALDLCRDALRRIRDQAQGHVEDRQPGWGRWQTTLRLAREGLGLPGTPPLEAP